jgi:hypothetical protein
MFTHYAAWMQTAPPVTTALLLDAVRTNWPQFLTRKAVLGGVGLCLLLALVLRRWPGGAHWLLLFIAGYSAAVSTTYFTPRASALTELCALVLAAGALSLVFTQEEHELSKQQLAKRRLHFKPNEPGLRINAAAFGSVLALGLLAGIGYDAWRVQRDLRGYWHTQRTEREAVYARALDLAGGDASKIYGRFDFIPPTAHMPWCLPGPSYSRLWVDDPRVAGLMGGLLPEIEPEEVLEAGQPSEVRSPKSDSRPNEISPDGGEPAGSDIGHRTPDGVSVVLLWPTPDNPRDMELAQQFDTAGSVWQPSPAPVTAARLWVRSERPAGASPVGGYTGALIP